MRRLNLSRSLWVGTFLCLFVTAILCRLISVSIFDAGHYRQEEARKSKTFEYRAERGIIYDRNGYPLVKNEDAAWIGFNKKAEKILLDDVLARRTIRDIRARDAKKRLLSGGNAARITAFIADSDPGLILTGGETADRVTEELRKKFPDPELKDNKVIARSIVRDIAKKLKEQGELSGSIVSDMLAEADEITPGHIETRDKYSAADSHLGFVKSLLMRLLVNKDINKKEVVVYTDDEAVGLLARAVNKPRDVVKDKIDRCTKNTCYVVEHGSMDIYNAVRDLQIRGINPELRTVREYPEKELGAGLVGSTTYEYDAVNRDPNATKQMRMETLRGGIEQFYDKELRGSDGYMEANVFWDGKPVADSERKMHAKQDGWNITLTIDRDIQFFAEYALRRVAMNFTPERAMAVVMDPKNGEILAMANYPFWDPNNRKSYNALLNQNLAAVSAYEPGSTMKAFTVAAAINEGLGPDEVVGHCSGYRYLGSEAPLKCDLHAGKYAHGHGAVTPRIILQESCNLGASYCGERLTGPVLYDYFDKFGLTKKACTEIGNESPGIWTVPSKWGRRDLWSVSFGQHASTTILNVAAGYCAIANGGVYYRPKLIKAIEDGDHNPVKTYTDAGGVVRDTGSPDPGVRVISKKTSRIVTELLIGCVEYGTGKNARIKGVECAGKTGSAQMTAENSVGKIVYTADRMASFVGYAPAYDPKLVVAVWVVKPHGSTHGATVAAPAWKQIMEDSLRYMKLNFSAG
ncbi:MAG: penicillin-binding protein 2 [Abditibacteriota bacterium]|nr:penicillin-binding protein 2 [Abditibacteriota bacterium]